MFSYRVKIGNASVTSTGSENQSRTPEAANSGVQYVKALSSK
jgi:hypothetical protein